MGRRGYPAEFRRRVLDLLASGRSVASVATDLGISDQTIYGWRQQDRIDRGEAVGLTSPEKAELAAARKKIAQLETQLAVATKAVEALKGDADPEGGTRGVEVIAAAGLPVQIACRVLGVASPGSTSDASAPPSERAVRPAWLTHLIAQVHAASHGRYGVRRVHAEITMARGMLVGHQQVGLLMRRAGLQGLAGRRKWKRIIPDHLATDLVERDFARAGPNQLWVTDITKHRTREGKVYCCVVLDAFSRRVVGSSIDSTPTAELATTLAACQRSIRTSPPAGTCPSEEREELALVLGRQARMREITRRIGGDPGTVSRELRRNAATRGGKLEYRALVAQWKAQQAARRPKVARLATTRSCASTSRSALLATFAGPMAAWSSGLSSRRGRG